MMLQTCLSFSSGVKILDFNFMPLLDTLVCSKKQLIKKKCSAAPLYIGSQRLKSNILFQAENSSVANMGDG